MSVFLGLLPAMALAQNIENAVRATIIEGWRAADGTHMAALKLDLAPGWKTYWRAPGDAGIPPSFDWRASRNVQDVRVEYPAPKPMQQGRYISIGYDGVVTFPLRITPRQAGQPLDLNGEIEIGICQDICVPIRLTLAQSLPSHNTRPDPAIVAALAERPYSAREAGVSAVSCRLSPTEDGLQLTAEITMAALGSREMAVVETSDPRVWVSPAQTRREGGTLYAEAALEHVEGRAFALQRSDLRITVLGANKAVDIRGCRPG